MPSGAWSKVEDCTCSLPEKLGPSGCPDRDSCCSAEVRRYRTELPMQPIHPEVGEFRDPRGLPIVVLVGRDGLSLLEHVGGLGLERQRAGRSLVLLVLRLGGLGYVTVVVSTPHDASLIVRATTVKSCTSSAYASSRSSARSTADGCTVAKACSIGVSS